MGLLPLVRFVHGNVKPIMILPEHECPSPENPSLQIQTWINQRDLKLGYVSENTFARTPLKLLQLAVMY